MSAEQFTVLSVLLISAALGGLYSVFLEHIHHLYFPDWIWLTVVAGNAFIVGTLALLETDFGIVLTSTLVMHVNIAWGTPIIIWQLWQWHERHKQRRQGLAKHPKRDNV